MLYRLQPHVLQAATPCARGHNPSNPSVRQAATPRVTGLVEEARALLDHVHSNRHIHTAAERSANSPKLLDQTPPTSPSPEKSHRDSGRDPRGSTSTPASAASAGRWHGWASKPLGEQTLGLSLTHLACILPTAELLSEILSGAYRLTAVEAADRLGRTPLHLGTVKVPQRAAAHAAGHSTGSSVVCWLRAAPSAREKGARRTDARSGAAAAR